MVLVTEGPPGLVNGTRTCKKMRASHSPPLKWLRLHGACHGKMNTPLLRTSGTSGCTVLGRSTKNRLVDRKIPFNRLVPLFPCGVSRTCPARCPTKWPPIQIVGPGSRTACTPRHFSQPPLVSTMDTKSQRPKRPDVTLSSLNVAIDAMNIAKDVVGMTPAKAAFGTVSVILIMIRVGFLLLRVSRLLDNVYRTP